MTEQTQASEQAIFQQAYALAQYALRKSPPPAHRRTDGRKPMGLLSWTLLHRAYLRPGMPLTLHDHLYLIDIYKCTSRQVVVKKSGQAGVSELTVSLAFHACDERNLDVLYIMPTAGDVQDFSQMRVETALEASAHLSALVANVAEKVHGRKPRQADNVKLKRVGKNWLVFRGGAVKVNPSQKQLRASNLKSVPADLIILDEYDEMPRDVLALARKRMGHSPVKSEWLVSTPSYPGVGIDLEWERSDQREWFIACHHCGKKQPLTIDQVVQEWDDFKRPLAWHGMKENRAFVACVRCGKELDRLARGEWVAKHFGRSVVGFHPTKLMSPHTELIEVVHNLDTVDESYRREAMNQDLGECYTPTGGQLPIEVLNACRRDYAHAPVAGVRTFMGVDVGSVLNVIIRAPEGNGAYRQLLAAEVGTFEDVDRLIAMYNVGTCVIDALPETKKARELQERNRRGQVWLAYFAWSDQGSKNPDDIVWDEDKMVVNLDRTRVIDSMYGRFYEQLNLLPANADQLPNYYSQLQAPIRETVRDRKGNFVSRYREDSADHYALAETYCYIATKKGSWWLA